MLARSSSCTSNCTAGQVCNPLRTVSAFQPSLIQLKGCEYYVQDEIQLVVLITGESQCSIQTTQSNLHGLLALTSYIS